MNTFPMNCKYHMKYSYLLTYDIISISYHYGSFYGLLSPDPFDLMESNYIHVLINIHVHVCKCMYIYMCSVFLSCISASNGDRINEGGIGDCFTSLGFDGKYIWIGGSKFKEEKIKPSRSPRIQRQQVIERIAWRN